MPSPEKGFSYKLAEPSTSMTPASYMSSRTIHESASLISLIAPSIQADQYITASTSPIQTPGSPFTIKIDQAKHRRVQFLKVSSTAQTARGIPGLTPPYQPSGPSLLRPIYDERGEELEPARGRRRSPLRRVALTECSSRITGRHSRGMPHAVTNAQSGFQALILCGPGIGLSTFTSVPNEYPKALINVANRPMVWYVLDWCYRMGVTDITLITPPAAEKTMAAALAQNPYLTSLPSPSPDLLAPRDLEFTTPTAELLRLPEVQSTIKSDLVLLPCDLICEVGGDAFLETYLTCLAGVGGVGSDSGSTWDRHSQTNFRLGGEASGRRGGLSIWYPTADREESVKGEECDFMGTVKMDIHNQLPMQGLAEKTHGTLRRLVWTTPMSELRDQVEEDKSWKIRQSLLRKYGNVKCLTQYRDSHIYFLPLWVKDFALVNEDFESVSEDLLGTWAKSGWRKPGYRAKFGIKTVFARKRQMDFENVQPNEQPVENELDLLSLSSTQVSQYGPRTTPTQPQSVQLASRVSGLESNTITAHLAPDEGGQETRMSGDETIPITPSIVAQILPPSRDAPLVRRVDTTPLLLSVSLLLAKLPSVEDAAASKQATSAFAHAAKVANTTTVAPRVTISRSDTLIDSNSIVATQCVIKSSCIGSSVSIGQGTRITGCVIMDGATIGDKCVLTGTVVGKKAHIGKGSTLNNCEVQDGNAIPDETEGKGEKYLVGGLEDDMDDDFAYADEDGSETGEDISV